MLNPLKIIEMEKPAEKTLFIINPISGGKDKSHIPQLISQFFTPSTFEICYTQGVDHATQLTREGIMKGFHNFVAVGGDGTVNEVAKALIHTNFNLGIIPFGSGNGLARHNKIPMSHTKAMVLVSNAKIKRIDTCSLNGMPFINMSGVGFDAHIGKLFAESKSRGFSTYLSTTINEFVHYKAHSYTLKVNGNVLQKDAFLISFANSSQYGNNAFIAPHADMEDGLLDVCIMKPFPPLQIVDLGFKLFTKGIEQSHYFETIRTDEVVLERSDADVVHLDGEPQATGATLKVKVHPKSLNLMV